MEFHIQVFRNGPKDEIPPYGGWVFYSGKEGGYMTTSFHLREDKGDILYGPDNEDNRLRIPLDTVRKELIEMLKVFNKDNGDTLYYVRDSNVYKVEVI